MIESEHTPLDTLFQALGDPTRRAMLRRLAEGEQTVTELAAPFEMSLAAASRHIKVLETAGLIRREVRWRTHHCRLNAEPLAAAQDWLAFYQRFWTGRLDKLESLLRAEDASSPPTDTPSPNPKETP
jgi:DNA-binding transcriptional ArsR family regulator